MRSRKLPMFTFVLLVVVGSSILAHAVSKPFLNDTQLEALERQGYSMRDIRYAQLLSSLFDLEVDHMDLLDGAQRGYRWFDQVVEQREERSLENQQARGLQAVGLATAAPRYRSLTAPDAEALLAYGFTSQEIVRANLVAQRFDWAIEEVLLSNVTVGDWRTLIVEIFDYTEPTIVSQAASPQWLSEAVAASQGRVSHVQAANMSARGFTKQDIMTAGELAQLYGESIDFVSILKGQDGQWGLARHILRGLSR